MRRDSFGTYRRRMTDTTGTPSSSQSTPRGTQEVTGHAGAHAVAAAQRHGVDTMFTLSGAHVFPLYDAAVGGQAGVQGAEPAPMRLVDVRHEQTAVFAAEAIGKLTRKPGLAVLTAGPGVTNGISGITSASFNGSPMVVLGGRAPQHRWGSGALQELDHPPMIAPVAKEAFTIDSAELVAEQTDRAFGLAAAPHRGPVFADIAMDVLFSHATAQLAPPEVRPRQAPNPEAVAAVARLVAQASRPVMIIGGDVWAESAEQAAAELAQSLDLPTIANGMGRGVLPRGHRLLASRARGYALSKADLVIVIGTPLDFRLGYGSFGGSGSPAKVVHIADSASQIAKHAPLAAQLSGDLTTICRDLADAYERTPRHTQRKDWTAEITARAQAAIEGDRDLLHATSDPIHPARIYGELNERLADDAVVIGDGGDFVSFAGRFIEPTQPGRWLDPGPFGCLGTGLGYATAARLTHPSSQVVLLLGDGAAGFSLMDVDSLVRHNLPVVMVVGNNSGWALEKHPMRFLYGYDVAADLRPTAYDEVVRGLGGAGETVADPTEIGPAMDRAFAAGVPYLINVLTDPAVAYPRSTTGV